MAYTGVPVVIEICDDVGDLAARVKSFDAETVEVEVKLTHDINSWNELSAEIAKWVKTMTEVKSND